ncbi:hypothetical protein CYMTET_41323 [Cymbomonas tetramitiformis]|uniref:E3 ubiquitin-protein ligase CHFR n=1 Tax=Cymbomonas tetramitiformis TaxID=36881 RepID=A0AAE0F0I2_9CHLO|nr:hypothetical protein CYMTET_44651 [Cymbomonas tetramitiformis]KAK3249247.1 hypothetical protein CYMTET_41323 [Cymbomonas tetramitiformis]|eukprot:gene25335-30925_t
MSTHVPEPRSYPRINQIRGAISRDEEPLNYQLHTFFNLGRKSVRLGRHPANDILLNCSENERIPLLLARFHAYIEYQVVDGDPVYTLGDKGSVNGTYVGSVMIPSGGRQRIYHGTTISFGGPMNVVRDNETLRNPFQFIFLERDPEQAVPIEIQPSAQLQLPQSAQVSSDEQACAVDIGEQIWTLQEAEEIVCCPICTETCVESHVLPCGHSFCGACILSWYDQRARNCTCPVCRKKVTEEPVQNVALEHIVELTVVPRMSSAQRSSRNEKKQEFLRVKQTRAGRPRSAMRRTTRDTTQHYQQMGQALTTFLTNNYSMHNLISGDITLTSSGSGPGAPPSDGASEATGTRGWTRAYTLIRRQPPCVMHAVRYRECVTCMGIIDRQSRPLCFAEQGVRDVYPVWHHFDCYAEANPTWTGQDVIISRELSEAEKSHVESLFESRRHNSSGIPQPTPPVDES